MKFRHLHLVSILTASLFTAPLARADDHDETPLGEQMEMISDAFKLVRRQVEDASANASTLEQLATIRAAAEKGLAFEPAYAAEKPAAERTAFIAKYREDMRTFIATIDEVAAALTAGDNPLATELVAKMRSAQRSGHKAYRAPKD
ncbi:cytochrome b562 [Synoicihabitans lomoniglobus]|uniref:Cytochrome b562 n=1 Tax=Synoicihabitans lomoniglobus TaxID=2909285 RepID=A0AAE9ZX94_9BACT|nr:cytochrome b562 [Opitutaceae bacterium LMO-M01]WED64223.1 cytochrome b562 [Opitutaceae bacterium LMO-M01]